MEEIKYKNYKSCFDIIGPIMVGPSSSHMEAVVVLLRDSYSVEHQACVRLVWVIAETHKDMGQFYSVSGNLRLYDEDRRVPRAVEDCQVEGMHIEVSNERTKPCSPPIPAV